ncbi:recombinase family protein [Pyxidicoccus parkwayensis]|uniref:recombinase family protein n=1 Tax=Pyxidicoccus parkwayensis TaxID=2813578 RepID=UPI001F511234|nr:recombinase family protein [Pyxidicoccus parkwaysis]
MSDKLQATHLQRRAVVYLRQSTLKQVLEHHESTTRQYALKHRAQELGWPAGRIDVIDEDLGQSGAGSAWRSGFRRLAEEVAHGRVGLILALEVSRLARSSADWQRLLELCALADVLIADEQAIYTPRDYNDRLLLGLKGTMSEAEQYWMRLRLQGGKLSKARRGELFLAPPVGYQWNEATHRLGAPHSRPGTLSCLHSFLESLCQVRHRFMKSRRSESQAARGSGGQAAQPPWGTRLPRPRSHQVHGRGLDRLAPLEPQHHAAWGGPRAGARPVRGSVVAKHTTARPSMCAAASAAPSVRTATCIEPVRPAASLKMHGRSGCAKGVGNGMFPAPCCFDGCARSGHPRAGAPESPRARPLAGGQRWQAAAFRVPATPCLLRKTLWRPRRPRRPFCFRWPCAGRSAWGARRTAALP